MIANPSLIGTVSAFALLLLRNPAPPRRLRAGQQAERVVRATRQHEFTNSY